MKSFLLIAFACVTCAISFGQNTVTPAKKQSLSDAHHFGVRAGLVLGLNNSFVTNGTEVKRSVLPGFTVGGFYRYQHKRLIVMPEFSFSRQGGAYHATGFINDPFAAAEIKKNTTKTVVYNFNLKAFVGAKVKGFTFYGGPVLAVQMKGNYSVYTEYVNGPTYSPSVSLKSFKPPILPELAVGVGYELPVGKAKKYGVNFDVQFSHALIKSEGLFDLSLSGNIGSFYTYKYYDEAVLFMVGFRI